jgi:four helix bundle protein
MSPDRHLRAFRATDAFAIEAYRLATGLKKDAHAGLAGELRRAAVRSGGAVVAASAGPPGGKTERRLLERARAELLEGRYYLMVARRLGLVDPKAYRGLTARQDAALRELELLLQPAAAKARS